MYINDGTGAHLILTHSFSSTGQSVKNLEKGAPKNEKKNHVFKEMIYRRKFAATIKKSFFIYNRNNNSLIETRYI